MSAHTLDPDDAPTLFTTLRLQSTMDDEKDDLEYGDDSSHTETEELLFRPATTTSRLSPVLKITTAIIIGVVVFAVTLLSLDSSLRTKFIPAELRPRACMFMIILVLRSETLLIKFQAQTP
jgi:hypothetical protein